MKDFILFIFCILVSTDAFPEPWQSFEIDRHDDNSYKITYIQADEDWEDWEFDKHGGHNHGPWSSHHGPSSGKFKEKHQNEKDESDTFDHIAKRFDSITSKIEHIVGTKQAIAINAMKIKQNAACEKIKKYENDTKNVFLLDEVIDANCSHDIIRAASIDSGPVFVFGLNPLKTNIYYLNHFMSDKGLVNVDFYTLPPNISEMFENYSYRTYVPVEDLSIELEESVAKDDYKRAISICRSLDDNVNGVHIKNFVQKLIAEGNEKLVSLAYRLWESSSQIIVKKYFPKSLQLILGEKELLIVFKTDNGILGLGNNGTMQDADHDIFTDCNHKQSQNLYWKLIPTWYNNRVTYKVWNPFYKQYLKIQQEVETDGSRVLWSGTNEWYIPGRFVWNIVPVKSSSDVKERYCIINVEHNQVMTSKTCAVKATSVVGKSMPCDDDHAWYIDDKDLLSN